ncbi:hypothetical protein GOP47_0018984 [Adiantum capillus-veneris]|uniref:AMP-activated protein kinase glycogen-binding domain-containing protein n=1 Tax=Adiantum capillus-veneris TaxID=13818 RepID=A0A9D4UEJ8_ADICA|nr:hypothetical protein GOP47_0018984 [Adiantum capillus-veneris]
MYSAEFFNRCNITLPDALLQGAGRSHGGRFILAKSRDDDSYRLPLSKSMHLRHLKDSPRTSLRKSKGIMRSVASVSSAEDSANTEYLENQPKEGASGLYFGQPTQKEEVIAIRESAVRASLMKKLSDINLYGRHLQRQLREKEDALLKCKSELETMESDIQILARLAQEIAKDGVKPGTRQIDGKYIQSHVALKLEELQERLLAQSQNIEAACYRDIPLVWYGVAEDVKVMGSFDGWTQGFQLSAEFTGSFVKFSATVKLRPGRYQIKYLIDGEWQVSPDLPSSFKSPCILRGT